MKDEIGTYPDIEVEIEIVDKIPFFMRSYHVKGEDKQIWDKK